MVTLQILDLPFLVRIQVAQQRKSAKRRKTLQIKHLQGLFFPTKWQKSVLWRAFTDAKPRTRKNPKICSWQNLTCIFTSIYAAMPVALEPSNLYFCIINHEKMRTKELSKTHICEDNDTISWIKKLRHKTQVMCSVPLLEQAVDILSKYKDKVKGGYLLPVLSNQKYNEYLKVIAEVCHIEKDISTHSSRHPSTDCLPGYLSY